MKKVLLKLIFQSLGISLLLIAGGGEALAQERGGTQNASAGTLMAAVMEEVGYVGQSQVLTQLSEYLEWSAAIIYLGVIVSAILTISLMGNYRSALWILVGPPMFFYMSGVKVADFENTVEGAGVEWRFGAFDDTETSNDKRKLLEDPEVEEAREVSFVFHRYNIMISEIFQKLISVITADDTRAQMMFMTRQRVLEELFAEHLDNVGIQGLMTYFQVHCNKEIGAAQYVALGMRNEKLKEDPYWEFSKKQYCNGWKESKPFSPGVWQDWAIDRNLYVPKFITKEDHQGPRGAVEDGNTTCEEMWTWIMVGATEAVNAGAEKSADLKVPPQAWRVSGTKTWEETVEAIYCKLTDGQGCDNGKILSQPEDGAENTDTFSCGSGEGAPAAPPGGDKLQLLTRLIGGYAVKKQLASSPLGSTMARVSSGHAGYKPMATIPLGVNPERAAEVLRRQAAHQHSDSRQVEAMMFAMLLPYLQGFILYVLAVTYPFFCLMLLLPGQAGAFLSWMALWAWAKSWDVGFAFVMIADEVLWELMPKTAFIDPLKAEDFLEPVNVLQMVFDGDHSYNSATYWLLVSGMLGAVPILTANVFMGAKKAVAGVMLKGISEMTTNFGAGAADRVAGGQVKAYTENMARLSTAKQQSAAATARAGQSTSSQAIDNKNKGGVISGAGGASKQNAGAVQNQTELNKAQMQRKAAVEQLRNLTEGGSN